MKTSEIGKKDGATPLYWAVYRNNEEIVALLLKAGVNPGQKPTNDRSPRELAQTKKLISIQSLFDQYPKK
jgi:ankyrin repeat protein